VVFLRKHLEVQELLYIKKYMEPITLHSMWTAVNCRIQGVVFSYFLLNGWQNGSQSVCWQGAKATFKATI